MAQSPPAGTQRVVPYITYAARAERTERVAELEHDALDLARDVTDARNLGFTSALSVSRWTVGVDAHITEHNSNIDNPNNPMFFVENFNSAQRDSYGIFIERNFRISDVLSTELGVRYNRIESNADEVNATPAMMGMPPAIALRDNFNNGDRKSSDEVLEILQILNREQGKTIVMVTHDPHAAAKASRVLYLDKGQLSREPGE